jgi:hypothetical protein
MWICISNVDFFMKQVIELVDLMIVVTLLVLINFLVAFARQSKRKWLRVTLFSVAFLLLFPALLFGLRAIM